MVAEGSHRILLVLPYNVSCDSDGLLLTVVDFC